MQTTFQSEVGLVKPSHPGMVAPLLSTGVTTVLLWRVAKFLVLAKDQVRDQVEDLVEACWATQATSDRPSWERIVAIKVC